MRGHHIKTFIVIVAVVVQNRSYTVRSPGKLGSCPLFTVLSLRLHRRTDTQMLIL